MTQNERRRTLKGLVERMYYYMSRRVKGKGADPRLYKGLGISPRDYFYRYALEDSTLRQLFYNWRRGGFKLRCRPTPDRLNSELGYIIGNIEFVTYRKNCSRAGRKPKRRVQ